MMDFYTPIPDHVPSIVFGRPVQYGWTQNDLCDASCDALSGKVIEYYHQTLQDTPYALSSLKDIGIRTELIDQFQLGYSNRTLGLQIPDSDTREGASIRASLRVLGLYRRSGHELFWGGLVVPTHSADKDLTGAFGTRIAKQVHSKRAKDIYWSHSEDAMFNPDGIGSGDTLILCKHPLDALVFYAAGYTNVVGMMGLKAFSDALLERILESDVRQVIMAFSGNWLEDSSNYLIAQALSVGNMESFRIRLPKKLDLYQVVSGAPDIPSLITEFLLSAQSCRQTYERIREDTAHD